MESPETWNLLTSSLASIDFNEAEILWAFLVLQGLLKSDDTSRQRFMKTLAAIIDEGDITGPSMARRLSIALTAEGIALEAGEMPDPWGKEAELRLAQVNAWRDEG